MLECGSIVHCPFGVEHVWQVKYEDLFNHNIRLVYIPIVRGVLRWDTCKLKLDLPLADLYLVESLNNYLWGKRSFIFSGLVI